MTSKRGPLSLEIERDGDSLVVRASGELDLATAPMLEKCLLHAFEGEASPIILDLTAVSFIDSMGLRSLLRAARHSDENGNHLRIDCGSAPVRRMIEVTGLKRSLPLTA